MRKEKYFWLIFLVVFGMMVCELNALDSSRILKEQGLDLYYTPNVTLAETQSLLQYLIEVGFADETPITVELNKTGKTYEFRMVVQEGSDKNDDVIQNMKIIAGELSENVFGKADVDVHLCDDKMNTMRVVVAFPPSSEETGEIPGVENASDSLKNDEFEGTDLYYSEGFSDAIVEKLKKFLIESEFSDGNPKTIQLLGDKDVVQFRMVVKKGMEQDQEFIGYCAQSAKEISQGVFDGVNIELHLCDENFETIKMLKSK